MNALRPKQRGVFIAPHGNRKIRDRISNGMYCVRPEDVAWLVDTQIARHAWFWWMFKHCWKKCRKIAKGAEHFSFIIREQFANLCNSLCCERMQNLSTDSRPRCAKEIRIAWYQTVGIFLVYNCIKQYVTRTISCRGCINVSMVCFIRRRYLPGPGTATPFLKKLYLFLRRHFINRSPSEKCALVGVNRELHMPSHPFENWFFLIPI